MKARALVHGKGEFAKAWRALQDTAEDVDEVDEARQEILDHLRALVRSARYQFEQGAVADALERCQALEKKCKGFAELESELTELLELANSDRVANEKRLESRLERIWRPVSTRDFGKIDLDLLMELMFFAREHESTAVGREAAERVPLARDLVRILRKMKAGDLDLQIAKRLEKGR